MQTLTSSAHRAAAPAVVGQQALLALLPQQPWQSPYGEDAKWWSMSVNKGRAVANCDVPLQKAILELTIVTMCTWGSNVNLPKLVTDSTCMFGLRQGVQSMMPAAAHMMTTSNAAGRCIQLRIGWN